MVMGPTGDREYCFRISDESDPEILPSPAFPPPSGVVDTIGKINMAHTFVKMFKCNPINGLNSSLKLPETA